MTLSLWLALWSIFLAWCWLLPNHYVPWTAFHMDAWAAVMHMISAAAILWCSRHEKVIPLASLIVLVVAVIPWVQYAAGLIDFIGPVWVAFLYLLGLALSIFVGFSWERIAPGKLGDAIFLAVCLASVLSVGLQLLQWLQLDLLDIWSMGQGHGRPYANVGQPNQLGTLLLWGIIGVVWGAVRKCIRPAFAIFTVSFLLFGLALTASRTAWIGVVILLVGAAYWRSIWPWRAAPWVALALGCYFFLLVSLMPCITELLLVGVTADQADSVARMSSETRFAIWELFLEAIGREPWVGYGWGQVTTAHLAVAADLPPLRVLQAHAHNLILDLLIWNGLPLGGLLVVMVGVWFLHCFCKINNAFSALLFLCLLIVLNHAMLEFPLHYAYFLLPVGLMVGALDASQSTRFILQKTYFLQWLVFSLCAGIFFTLVRDYMRVEASYQALRFEWANIQSKTPREPPTVLLLDHLGDLIVMARFEPYANMNEAQLEWMRRVAVLHPNAGVIYKLILALVWSGQPDEAQIWFRKMCAVVHRDKCSMIFEALVERAKTDPLLKKIQWENPASVL